MMMLKGSPYSCLNYRINLSLQFNDFIYNLFLLGRIDSFFKIPLVFIH